MVGKKGFSMHSKMAIFLMVCAFIASAFFVSFWSAAAAPSTADASSTTGRFEQPYTLHVPLHLTLEEYLNAVANASFAMESPSF